jgi:Spy/CpxP family protein refolding chaperone
MKTRMLLYTLGVIALITPSTIAQSLNQPEQAKARIEKRTKLLAEKLSLSEQQTAQVRNILGKYHNQAVKDREAYKDDSTKRREAARHRLQNMNKEIEALLNAEQKTKYEQLKQDRRAEIHTRRQEQKNHNKGEPFL